MPFCQITNNTTLHYITNSPGGDVSLFDHSKPTILLLHPVALDSSWLRDQFNEPRLTNSYNLIAVDQRNAGRSKSPYSARRDSYVDAADLGFLCELLQLPPVHVFAVQLNSVWAAVRFALLFPSQAISLCLVGIPADVPLDWTPKAYSDLVELWCFPPDLDIFEQANLEMSHFMFSGQASSALLDEVVAHWQTHLSPRNGRRVLELTFGRCPPTKEEYANIRIPTLLLTGDKSSAHPVKEATKTHEAIEGSQFIVIRGAPELFSILPRYTSITHRVFCDFLRRQPPPPTFTPGTPDVARVAREALARLAEISGDASIAARLPSGPLMNGISGQSSAGSHIDPDPIMFSMWKPEAVAQHQAYLDHMGVGEAQAFSPLDAQGIPIRKFSSRHDDQWTSSGFNTLQDSGRAITGIMIKSTS